MKNPSPESREGRCVLAVGRDGLAAAAPGADPYELRALGLGPQFQGGGGGDNGQGGGQGGDDHE